MNINQEHKPCLWHARGRLAPAALKAPRPPTLAGRRQAPRDDALRTHQRVRQVGLLVVVPRQRPRQLKRSLFPAVALFGLAEIRAAVLVRGAAAMGLFRDQQHDGQAVIRLIDELRGIVNPGVQTMLQPLHPHLDTPQLRRRKTLSKAEHMVDVSRQAVRLRGQAAEPFLEAVRALSRC